MSAPKTKEEIDQLRKEAYDRMRDTLHAMLREIDEEYREEKRRLRRIFKWGFWAFVCASIVTIIVNHLG